MPRPVNNFGRFFVAFRRLVIHGDPEETKRQLVRQFTEGRTDSLREMTLTEYSACCAAVEELATDIRELRRHRSVALGLLQEAGVNTRDWDAINRVCRNSRIAGKSFGSLDIDELKQLSRKLRAIIDKGGFSNGENPGNAGVIVISAAPTVYKS